jgi:serine phosphatase RsbU (regulator of sigma subunit)
MNIPKALVCKIILLLFTTNILFAGKKDSLYIELEQAKNDTTRVKICYLLSTEYESTIPDSAFFWLNKGLSISQKCTKASIDSTLCYYHAVILTSIGRLNAILSKDLDNAKILLDSGVAVFNRLIEESPGKWLERKLHKGLSVSYGMQGRIAYSRGDIKKATDYFTQTLIILERLNDRSGSAMMYNNLGVMHRLQSNYAKSLFYFQKAYDVFDSFNDSTNVAGVLVNIGSVSEDIGAFDKSLENYLKALDIFKTSNQKKNLASTLVNIGNVLVSSKNTYESINYFKQALEIYKYLDDKKGIADGYQSLGNCYKDLNNIDTSYYYLFESKKVNELIDNKIGLTNNYQVLGEVNFFEKKYSSALKNFTIALTIAEEIGISTANTKNFIAKVHYIRGDTVQALKWADDALKESTKLGLITTQKDIYETMVAIYERMGNHQLALYYYKNFFSLYDSILSRDRSHKFAELETLYQLEQKEKAIASLEKEKAIREFELKEAENTIYWQRIQSYFSLGVMVLLIVILFLLYHQFRIKRTTNKSLKQQNTEIQQKNEEITAQKEEIELQRNEMERQKELLKEKSEQLERFNWLLIDSIDYASNIQSALLPSETVFSNFFQEHFIIFYPKDVVSGDFYWAYPKENNIIIAVADCTGHGVPGGFMSMLGISALNDLISKEITEPSAIINNLRLIIIDSFKQTGKIGDQQDGMDISIISYTKGNDYIEFAGANQQLLLVRENFELGRYELNELKGEKMPVSFHPKMRPFTTQKVNVQTNDQIFLFTDGFRHQLGGQGFAQKYGKENFKKLILENTHREMEHQKNVIEDTFFRWISDKDQLDDITIIGLKI